MRERLKTFLLAAIVALFGYLVAGCDGGAGPGAALDAGAPDSTPPRLDGGVPQEAGRADGGATAGDSRGPLPDGVVAACDIPSPTGDQATWYGKARDLQSSNRVLVMNSVREACEAWKAGYAASGLLTPDPAVVAGVDCADAANDFQGSSGRPWSVYALDPDGTPCSATASSGSCEAKSLIEMAKTQSSDPQKRWYVRSWALCTSARVFAGWLYTAS